jgi:hypothetical protein
LGRYHQEEKEVNIVPIPFEQGRFYVQSESRPEVLHVVDLAWQEETWTKPHPQCGCERGLAHNEYCKHLEAVVAWELRRIQHEKGFQKA